MNALAQKHVCACVGVYRACGAGHLVTKTSPCSQHSSTAKHAAAICHCPFKASLYIQAVASKVAFSLQAGIRVEERAVIPMLGPGPGAGSAQGPCCTDRWPEWAGKAAHPPHSIAF